MLFYFKMKAFMPMDLSLFVERIGPIDGTQAKVPREIARSNFQPLQELGKGAFGVVYKGLSFNLLKLICFCLPTTSGAC